MIRKRIPELFALATVIFFILAMVGNSSFQECAHGGARTAPDYLDSGSTFFSAVLYTLNWSRLTCVGVFINAEHEAILASFTVLLALFTLALWSATSKMSLDAKASADKTLKTIDDNSKKELRAYISVIVGDAIFQETGKGLRFQGRPVMVNTGRTPAYRVGFKAMAEILPVPLPDNFEFPLTGESTGAATLGPHQNFIMSPVVPGFVLDSEVPEIMKCNGRALYVWGVVTYRDAFGRLRKTEFSQHLLWQLDGKIMGYYTDRHNHST
jgi:hypothetical protein